MGKYKFKVSRQAKAWFDDIVSVEADSREEAEEILREEAAVVYGRGTRRIQCGLRYG